MVHSIYKKLTADAVRERCVRKETESEVGMKVRNLAEDCTASNLTR